MCQVTGDQVGSFWRGRGAPGHQGQEASHAARRGPEQAGEWVRGLPGDKEALLSPG